MVFCLYLNTLELDFSREKVVPAQSSLPDTEEREQHKETKIADLNKASQQIGQIDVAKKLINFHCNAVAIQDKLPEAKSVDTKKIQSCLNIVGEIRFVDNNLALLLCLYHQPNT